MHKFKVVFLTVVILSSISINAFSQNYDDFSNNKGRYLIITHDIFYNAVLPLARWKHEKGVEVEIARISQTGSTASQISNYIQTAYNTWSVPPEYVLLVGDTEYIPVVYGQIGWYDYHTDNQYGDVAFNYPAELFVGRLSGDTANNIDVMVSKTIGYEKAYELEENSNWMLSATTIVREDSDGGDIYYQDTNYITDLLQENGYLTIDNFYKNQGHNQNDVEEAITDGRAFVNYRGSASMNWYSPFQVNPNDMNNGFMLPIIMSATCHTGDFANDGGDCENLTRAGTPNVPRGAVAYFATNTHGVGMGLSEMRSKLDRSFFDAIFNEGKTVLGEACLRAKLKFLQSYPNDEAEYYGWNLIGDPELNIWMDQPQQITVEHLPMAPLGEFTFNIYVKDDDYNPVENAKVCVFKDDEVYAIEMTDEDGLAPVFINAQTYGDMKITVTGENFVPYQTTIQVVEQLTAIEGYVTNGQSGYPLEYARVYVESANQFCFSDENGYYRIYLPAEGTYRIEAELFGYFDYQSENVTVDLGGTLEHQIFLDPKPMGILEGFVTDENGAPLSDVTLKPMGVAVGAVTSDETGYYIFPEIPGGYAYEIGAIKEDYAAKVKAIDVPINENIELSFELSYINDFEDNNGGFSPQWEWEWGIPTQTGGPGEAYSGEKVWGTDMDNYYDPTRNQSLYTKTYFLDYGKDEYKLSFYHWYECQEGWDGGNVQVTADSVNWDVLIPESGYPDLSVVALGGQPGYTGSLFTWTYQEFDLSDYVGQTVFFRFRFASTNTTDRRGWFIDNFSVYGGCDPESKIITEISPASPSIYHLEQNYPNPFNPSTTIAFTIPHSEESARGVELQIYNVSGKLVKTLIDAKMESGYHSVVWNGKDDVGQDVASGVYFYKLIIKNIHQQTKQMLLIK